MDALWKALEFLVQAAPLATLAAVYVTYRVVMAVRLNDLAHMDKKIDGLHEDVLERFGLLDRRIDRLDQRLDTHLEKGADQD